MTDHRQLLERAQTILTNLADDLRAEIEERYRHRNVYPGQMAKFNLDMQIVNQAMALSQDIATALAQPRDPPDSEIAITHDGSTHSMTADTSDTVVYVNSREAREAMELVANCRDVPKYAGDMIRALFAEVERLSHAAPAGGEPVAWLETEPGVTVDQLRSPMALCLMSTMMHWGVHPEPSRPDNCVFPLFTTPPAVDVARLRKLVAKMRGNRDALGFNERNRCADALESELGAADIEAGAVGG